MPDEKYEELLHLGPFLKWDATKADPIVEEGSGTFAVNVNPRRKVGALMPSKGRAVGSAINAPPDPLGNPVNFGSFIALAEVVTEGDHLLYLCLGDGAAVYYDPDPASFPGGGAVPFQTITGLNPFDQAIQYGGVVYTNGGQRLFVQSYPSAANPSGNTLQAYDWQYPALAQAPFMALSISTAAPTGAQAPGTYFYVTTQQTELPALAISNVPGTDSFLTSETSVATSSLLDPNQIVINSVPHGGIQIAPGSGSFTGTNNDGTTWTTNLYRQSSNQAGYQFVANLTSNAPYIDIFSDAQLLSNRALVAHRDPPPLASGTNQGSICIHKNRAWVFVLISSADTLQQPQTQAWYSAAGRPWEFDSTTQVLLIDSDIASEPVFYLEQFSGGAQSPFVDYATLNGNEPLAMVPVGTILMLHKRRETWAVYGDDPTSFIQRYLYDIGIVSRHSACRVQGGEMLLSESGPYFFDGSAPNYPDEDIRDYLRPIPGPPPVGSTGINPTDQARSASAFSNKTWYLTFPTVGVTIGFHTGSQTWDSVIPYAPSSEAAFITQKSLPSAPGSQSFNRIVAGRNLIIQQSPPAPLPLPPAPPPPPTTLVSPPPVGPGTPRTLLPGPRRAPPPLVPPVSEGGGDQGGGTGGGGGGGGGTRTIQSIPRTLLPLPPITPPPGSPVPATPPPPPTRRPPPPNPNVQAYLDYWFADDSFDLGQPQTFLWQGALSESGKPGSEKQYHYLTVHVPPGTQGEAIVTLQVDSQAPIVWDIEDLSVTTRHIKKLGSQDPVTGMSGQVRGFMAFLTVQGTGVAGQPCPMIFAVRCWGAIPPDRMLTVPN